MKRRGIEQQDGGLHLNGKSRTLKAKLSELGLSRRQSEVTLLAVSGLSNREIADRLFIAEQTVKDHLWDIYQRADVHRRSSLIAKLLGLDAHAPC
jgi:DNA-binding CsgD family transcriptional regulator